MTQKEKVDFSEKFETVEILKLEGVELKPKALAFFVKYTSAPQIAFKLHNAEPYKTGNVSNVMTFIDHEMPRPQTFKEIYEKVKNFYQSRVALIDEREYLIFASFTILSWLWDGLEKVPYLQFLGAPGTGKTRACEALSELCYRNVLGGNVSVAALPRLIHHFHALPILDEFTATNDEEKSEIIKILNAGYRRGQYYVRAGKEKDEVIKLHVFSPKVIAGTEPLAPTLLSRCITINMYRIKIKPTKTFPEERLWYLDILSRMRFHNLKTDFTKFISEIESVLIDTGFDSRFAEISAPLIFFTPSEDLKNLLEYFLEKYKIRSEEEKTSLEGEVVKIIDELMQKQGSNNPSCLKVSEIVEAYLTTNHIDTRQRPRYDSIIGKVLSRLGLNKKRTEEGNIIVIENKKWELIKKRYLEEEKVPEDITLIGKISSCIFEKIFVPISFEPLLDSDSSNSPSDHTDHMDHREQKV